MDYRKPTLMQGLFGAPNFRAMGRPELTEVMNFGTPYYAQKAQRQLARLGPQGLLGGTNFPQAAPSISPQAISMAQAAMPQLPQSQAFSSEQPMVSSVDEIERASVPSSSSGLLGSIGGGLSGAASELRGLFSGEEGQARARALSKSLLSGPSRTPISFGQSVAEGLAAGSEEIERTEQRKFTKEQRARQKKQIEAQNKLADVLADPEATDTEKKNAFKAAYPVEAFKAEGKTVDLVKQIGDIAIRKKQSGIPLTEVEQDAYNKRMSAGGFNLMEEAKRRSSMIDEPDSAQPRDTRVLATPAQQQAREELERRRRQREER